MARTYQVISADGHVETPPDDWMKHVPDKYKDRAPRLIKLEDGGEAWQVEGLPLMQNGLNLTGGSPIVYNNESYYNADGSARPGTGSPEQRLREQDQDGVDAEVLYPPVFASRFIEAITDRRVYVALVQAYNDYLAEYCSAAPDRLIGNGIIPATNVDDAVAELKRCKSIGILSMSPGKFPNGGGTLKPEDDKFWATALEIGMPISPHLTIGDRAPAPPPGPNQMAAVAAQTGPPTIANSLVGQGQGPMFAIAQFIAEGVFDRFPDLKLYFAETNASWMPSTFFFLDDGWDHRKHLYPNNKLTMKPSEYIEKHCLFSFIRDPMAMQLRDKLPAENLMWGSDFPHSVGSFPESKKWMGIIFEGVPETLKRRILVDNPCEFFGLDPSKALTETPGVTVGAR